MSKKLPEPSKRYTPKRSLESLRNRWMAVQLDDPRLNHVGQVLAKAAREGSERFQQVCRELHREL